MALPNNSNESLSLTSMIEVEEGRSIRLIEEHHPMEEDTPLPYATEKIIKQHQEERDMMRSLGPLIPIHPDHGHQKKPDNIIYPLPMRRASYNATDLRGLQTSEETMVSPKPSESLKSAIKADHSRSSKTVNFTTVEEIKLANVPKVNASTSLENKVDLLLDKMDKILEHLSK